MSVFVHLGFAPVIEVFDLNRKFDEDNSTCKINLGLGAYRTDDGKPWVLPVVREAEKRVVADENINHEYLPICGLHPFRQAAARLALGDNSPAISENRVLSIQCMGGTGTLRLAAEFLKQKLKFDTVYVSSLTWDNHVGIFQATGYSQIHEYSYWDPITKGLDFQGLTDDLKNATEKSVVIFHTCAHNTTANDPTEEQWKEIFRICKRKQLMPLMDCTYQGLVSGDVDTDAFPLRHLDSEGFEFLIAQSFSKNFGLYNERLGNLCLITKDRTVLDEVRSQFEFIIRKLWSNPCHHGARTVSTILNDPKLCTEWKEEVKVMADRIKSMRKLLYNKLIELNTPGSWDFISSQTGMFIFTGMTKPQVECLCTKYHIYLTKTGRINMCAVTSKNVDYIAKAIHDAVVNY
ncbi:hypothetical protein LOTGIDRAFT_207558 [Lottia gigantea]|uniref:Aspartate aminotransferase n=1 Tax=Lottia gigantea TaxID=225164 RepID=V4AIZ3_LOTGI|nr:hypothetical protein LOTGIDRAFT_207558 [Lottia gigantea]ESP04109.1 hypothetical protein LOTGIDRAFT_207558 [Lottia gigantea]